MSQSIVLAWYDCHAEPLAVDYRAEDPAILHGWAFDLLPKRQDLVLEVGACTGRDTAWLSGQGLDVVALEPEGHAGPSSDAAPGADGALARRPLPELRTT